MTRRAGPRKPPPDILPTGRASAYYAGAFDALAALRDDESGDPYRALKWALIEASTKHRQAAQGEQP